MAGLLFASLTDCKTQHSAAVPQQPGTESRDTSSSSAPLAGTHWKLTELNGKSVATDTTSSHEPYFIVQTTDSTIKGNGGCNGFGGRFEWEAPNRIGISRIISTMMACEQIQRENEFFKTLQMADNYYIIGDTLILNRARMAPLARLQAVYLK